MSQSTREKVLILVFVIVAVAAGVLAGVTLPGRCKQTCQEANPEWDAYVDWGTFDPCKCKDVDGNLKVP